MFETLAPPSGRPPLLDLLNGHPAPHAPQRQTPQTTGPAPAPEVPAPLGAGWLTVVIVVGVMAALIALGGMVLSFRAVSAEMVPAFGARWAWLVPIVVDLTVFVFSGVDLVLARLDMSHPLARWTVYGATFGTVWLNYSAGGSAAGRTAHVLMPSIWVVFIELMRHVVRRQTNLATGSIRQPIPATRWIVSPWPTLKLWRRMILWRQHSYTAALAMERTRLGAIATARQVHGRQWRKSVGPLLRLQIGLGEVDAEAIRSAAPTGSADPTRPGEPIRPDAGTRSDPIPAPAPIQSGRPARRTPATRSPRPVRPAATRSEGALLAAAREAMAGRKPTADAIRAALHIAPSMARSLRDALNAERAGA